jgi:hypothetical protein
MPKLYHFIVIMTINGKVKPFLTASEEVKPHGRTGRYASGATAGTFDYQPGDVGY